MAGSAAVAVVQPVKTKVTMQAEEEMQVYQKEGYVYPRAEEKDRPG